MKPAPSISSLLAAADQATPVQASRSAWFHLLPVAEKLIQERGFTLWGAVGWLIERGAVPAKRKRHCYDSLNGVLRRRRRRPQASADAK